jgi:hypothetical protein
MKLVIHPRVSEGWLRQIQAVSQHCAFRWAQPRRMKRTAFLITVGRGVIVDLTDLTEALRTADIAGARLDVFEVEPLPGDHRLWSSGRRWPPTHPRFRSGGSESASGHLRRFESEGSLRNVVDRGQWF